MLPMFALVGISAPLHKQPRRACAAAAKCSCIHGGASTERDMGSGALGFQGRGIEGRSCADAGPECMQV